MKTITLLSGGLDSMVSTAIARQKHKIILALTFDYGQRAAKREILASKKLCKLWKIKHKVIKLPWLKEITHTALVDRKHKIPTFSTYALTHPGLHAGGRAGSRTHALTARAVWVPNRNAVFINIAASFAESLGADSIITGFNKEEAITFPDNSAKFVSAVNKMLEHGTLRHVTVVSYTQKMTKIDMAKYAVRRSLPLGIAWPCYEGGRALCMRCESCIRFKTAILSVVNLI